MHAFIFTFQNYNFSLFPCHCVNIQLPYALILENKTFLRRNYYYSKRVNYNVLDPLSGAQMGSNHTKNRGRKSPDTLPSRIRYKYKGEKHFYFCCVMLGCSDSLEIEI